MSTTKADDIAPSYYEAIGAAPAVREAVDRFYDRLLTDPELAPFFADTALPKLKAHQVALFAKILGGPDLYKGRDLSAAHAGMGITDAQYAKVGGHLVAVLTELGVGDDVLEAVGTTLAAVKPEIVETPTA